MNSYSIKHAAIGLVWVLILFITGNANVQAQTFDHETYPKLDFDFKHLELDLGFQPQNLRMDGAAKYTVEANIDDADTVIVYASHLDISDVQVNGDEANYQLSNDSLLVPLQEEVVAGDTYELTIRYSGDPRFGLLVNAHENAWASLLPKAQRHWIPIVDNPHNELSTTLNISVPAEYQVWASGSKTGEEAASEEIVTYHFESEEIPASAITFAAGEFESDSRTAGNTLLNLAVEEALSDTVETAPLLETAGDYLETVEDSLEMEYPFSDLNIIVLSDHTWEPKSWGASTVYLYLNRGDLEAQLLRGVVGQWFGVFQREAQWSQADAMNVHQTLLAQQIGDSTRLQNEDSPEYVFNTTYDGFEVQRWNEWQRYVDEWEGASVAHKVAELKADLLDKLPPVVSWNTYADYWYQNSGQPVFEIPVFETETEEESTEEPADSVAYKVDYSLDEAEGELVLTFTAKEGMFEELTTLPALETYPNSTDTSEVTFTGNDDTVMLRVDPTISTLLLDTSAYPELHLDEIKPSSFLLFELREGETLEQRREAAGALGHHSDNPDLQLAIKDFLQQDLEPEIQAALLSSLSNITQGATGTEETFFNALQDENQVVRDSALTALQHYESNETVQRQVRSVAMAAEDTETFVKAVRVLTAISNSSVLDSFVEELIDRNVDEERAIITIREMANTGETGEAVSKAELFTDNDYPYIVRESALELLIQHDEDAESWLLRAESLLDEADPRIRMLVLKALERHSNDATAEFLQEYRQDEYDARVYHQLQEAEN